MAAAKRQPSGSAPGGLRTEWRGLRGARLRAAAPRYLVLVALAALLALGLRALLWPPRAPQPSPPPASADRPSEDFALQFARAYLSYDSARPNARRRALAPFLPASFDSAGGFLAASGSRSIRWAEVASDQPALAGGRVITVAAAVSTQRLPVYLAVTVRHRAGHGLALGAYPSLVGAPLVDYRAAPAEGTAVEDRTLLAVVERVLRNYLAGSTPNLTADLAPGATVTLPTVRLAVQRVAPVVWIARPGSGAVLATVTAADRRGATYTLAYELGIQRRERPYVDFIEVIPSAS